METVGIANVSKYEQDVMDTSLLKELYGCEKHIKEKCFFVIFRLCIKTYVNLAIQFNFFKIVRYGG